MSWQAVASKDFEDVIRSWMLWAIVGVFTLMMGIIAVGIVSGGTSDASAEQVYRLFSTLGGEFLIPLTSLVVGYMAITGERESGGLRVLFGLSHNRFDIFVGKVYSRVLTMITASVVLVAVTAGLILLAFGSIELGVFLGFTGLTLLFAVSFTGIALGISAATGSRTKALSGAVGTYVLFMIVWDPFVAVIHRITQGSFPGLNAPKWYFFVQRLNPITAYREALSLLTDTYIPAMVGANIVENIPNDKLGPPMMLTNRVGEPLPFYLTEWFSAIVLVAWFVVPVAVGYLLFDRADLG
jgi:ABC-2 type transport system permease protein